MKKLVLLCVFVIGLTTTIQAQENESFKTDTVEFLKLTGAGSAFEMAIDQIGAMVSTENKEAYTKEAVGTLDGLFGKMANMYMEEFTHSEIKELTAFYKSDLGKKLAGKQVELTQKAMALGQTWGMEVSEVAKKY